MRRQWQQIRRSEPTDTFKTLVASLVLTRLDYGNGVLVQVEDPSTPVGAARGGVTDISCPSIGPHHRRARLPLLAARGGANLLQDRRSSLQSLASTRAATSA